MDAGHVSPAVVAAPVQDVAELLLQRPAQAHHVVAGEDVLDARISEAAVHQFVNHPADAVAAVEGLEHGVALERSCGSVGVGLCIGLDCLLAGRCLTHQFVCKN